MFADGAGTMTKMVSIHDGGHILTIHGDFVEVISKAKGETLSPHRSNDHAIDLQPGYNLPYGRITIKRSFSVELSGVERYSRSWVD